MNFLKREKIPVKRTFTTSFTFFFQTHQQKDNIHRDFFNFTNSEQKKGGGKEGFQKRKKYSFREGGGTNKEKSNKTNQLLKFFELLKNFFSNFLSIILIFFSDSK
jgi:hypothetical protein